jgi:hypothetical protein
VYAKVFEQIYDSSIADNWKTRIVFQDMIVLADSDGVIDKTPEAIAARTRLPFDMVTDAIKELESPDPRSRTHEEEGRRIVKIDPGRDWGWRIVNYLLYRNMKEEFDRKSYMLRYMRKKRLKNQGCVEAVKLSLTKANTVKRPLNFPPSSSLSTSKEGGAGEGGEVELPTRFPKTAEEAIQASAAIAAPERFIRKTWDAAMSRCGRDARGQPILSWAHYLSACKAYEQDRNNRAKYPSSAQGRPGGVELTPGCGKGPI